MEAGPGSDLKHANCAFVSGALALLAVRCAHFSVPSTPPFARLPKAPASRIFNERFSHGLGVWARRKMRLRRDGWISRRGNDTPGGARQARWPGANFFDPFGVLRCAPVGTRRATAR